MKHSITSNESSTDEALQLQPQQRRRQLERSPPTGACLFKQVCLNRRAHKLASPAELQHDELAEPASHASNATCTLKLKLNPNTYSRQ
jgi:hypothetical protein